ncbi:MAG: L-seryl-tRNA(Sec) selenium transferase [Planctomycetes bacterium RBG_19FT_COMBO_48_8]|nr:MAG: L-seryl-tRNA(Sec) selenium transferase [Planctomycetes bacterium RBG_19FT_COMBO_48_8]
MAKQNDSAEAVLRKLPAVDTLLKEPDLESSAAELGRTVVVDSIRRAIDEVRELLMNQALAETDEDAIRQKIIADVRHRLEAISRPHYRKVVNATGIILHTALGRAVLSAQALRQIQDELSGYSLLQTDTETGKRSKRDGCIEQLLQQLTGAEAATVVNNNAAATSIVLNTVADGKEVIVSRGQLVEIGGAFRLPDVMAFSGAKLVEVGTTNKTHPRDYVNAITENTAAILRVHPSNYKIQGFSSEVSLDELVEIAHTHGLVMIDDVGAGALIDFSQFGFEPEPTLSESIAKGADIVTSSADKLIGASQGGIILGRAKLIEAVRKNQFARIVRVGKLTLTALEATLKLFLDESLALREVPTLKMLRRDSSEIAEQAERIVLDLRNSISGKAVTTICGFSQMGSGSLPAQNLATTLVALRPEKISAESLAQKLRQYGTPIFTRIQNDQVLIDPRTLLSGDEKIVVEALIEIFSQKS